MISNWLMSVEVSLRLTEGKIAIIKSQSSLTLFVLHAYAFSQGIGMVNTYNNYFDLWCEKAANFKRSLIMFLYMLLKISCSRIVVFIRNENKDNSRRSKSMLRMLLFQPVLLVLLLASLFYNWNYCKDF